MVIFDFIIMYIIAYVNIIIIQVMYNIIYLINLYKRYKSPIRHQNHYT